MGQFAKDWNQLKTIIRQKDDAIEHQAGQIATLQKQLTGQPQLDADDQKAIAEVHQTIGQNGSPAAAAAVKPPASAATTVAAAPTAVHPQSPAVTTFVK